MFFDRSDRGTKIVEEPISPTTKRGGVAMATLKELLSKYGEDGIVKLAMGSITATKRRKEYSDTPEAKSKATQRRERDRKELAAFRKWKDSGKR